MKINWLTDPFNAPKLRRKVKDLELQLENCRKQRDEAEVQVLTLRNGGAITKDELAYLRADHNRLRQMENEITIGKSGAQYAESIETVRAENSKLRLMKNL